MAQVVCKEDLYNQLRSLVSEQMEIPKLKIRPESSLEAMELDSLEVMELDCAIEAKLGITTDNEWSVRVMQGGTFQALVDETWKVYESKDI